MFPGKGEMHTCLSSEKIKYYSITLVSAVHESSLESKGICFLCFGAIYLSKISE